MTSDWTKSQWRDEFKRRRMQVEPEIRGRILNHAREWILSMRPSRIQLYLPKLASHELDTTDLLRFCKGCGIPVAVPRVVDVVTGTMELVDWSADLPMVTNRFGIDEPLGGTIVDSTDIDAWIVPLLGADRAGNRLGYGAGFYDRILKGSTGRKAGLIPDSCWVDSLPTIPTDVPLDVLITENGVFNSYL
jgi:5-formyltetrahydrofolate cyclo-ligase